MVQTGHFEPLLCHECEGVISKYECRFKELWMDTIPGSFKDRVRREDGDVIQVEIDWDTFKLFHLSVFWRAMVSEGFKVDNTMSLGPYEVELRERIRNGDPGKPGEFPVIGQLVIHRDNRPHASVTPVAQREGRFYGHYCYFMSYAYCDWFFVVARPGPRWIVDLEAQYRDKGIFCLLTAPFCESALVEYYKTFIGKP